MVAGRLQEKNGYFYIALSYKDSNGKRKEPWFATGLKVKGNKRLAEEKLLEYRTNFDIKTGKLRTDEPEEDHSILFGDYLFNWLESIKGEVAPTTYGGYYNCITKAIRPYFNAKLITLQSITADDIETFYRDKMFPKDGKKGIKGKTALRYHANIRKCLQEAFRKGLIPNNPADLVKRPKEEPFISDYYNSKQIIELLQIVRGSKIEFACYMASYYGLRRGEIIGLKWSAFDLTYDTVTIRHTVSTTSYDGVYRLVAQDRTKSKKSYRTLPIAPELKTLLVEMKTRQETNKKLLGDTYNHKYDEYVYVDDVGKIVRPDYVSQHFPIVIKKNNLKKIRFHDLRHSCATMLRHLGVKMEDIQQYLGHSNIVTTEKTYAHFEKEQNKLSLGLIVDALAEKEIEKPDAEM
ncbi:MAG: site-specific integrase [Clostridiales bacterium]|nr:site-specific integrase [Clostridiales bacterium]